MQNLKYISHLQHETSDFKKCCVQYIEQVLIWLSMLFAGMNDDVLLHAGLSTIYPYYKY